MASRVAGERKIRTGLDIRGVGTHEQGSHLFIFSFGLADALYVISILSIVSKLCCLNRKKIRSSFRVSLAAVSHLQENVISYTHLLMSTPGQSLVPGKSQRS